MKYKVKQTTGHLRDMDCMSSVLRITKDLVEVKDPELIVRNGEILHEVAVGLGTQDYAVLFLFQGDHYILEVRLNLVPRRFVGSSFIARRAQHRSEQVFYWETA